MEIKIFGGGRLLELCVLSLICEFLHFCHIHHTKSGDTGCIWISSTLGEKVYWKFVDNGRHIVNDEVSVISEIRGKWERGRKEFDGGCRYLAYNIHLSVYRLERKLS